MNLFCPILRSHLQCMRAALVPLLSPGPGGAQWVGSAGPMVGVLEWLPCCPRDLCPSSRVLETDSRTRGKVCSLPSRGPSAGPAGVPRPYPGLCTRPEAGAGLTPVYPLTGPRRWGCRQWCVCSPWPGRPHRSLAQSSKLRD